MDKNKHRYISDEKLIIVLIFEFWRFMDIYHLYSLGHTGKKVILKQKTASFHKHAINAWLKMS
jgi:hypothetical protein